MGGDFLVYEYKPFQEDPDMTMGQARKYLHRIKEVRAHLSKDTPHRFPLAERKAAIARMPPGLAGGVPDDQPLPATEGLEDEDAPDPTVGVELPGDGPLPDERGTPGWSDVGTWCRGYKDSSIPPHIDSTVWKTFSDKQQAKEIAEYLEALRNRTYVRPSRPEGRREPGAAAKTKHKNQAAQAYQDVIARLPMHITILEDGSQSECETLLTHSITTDATEISFPSDIFVSSYHMMNFSAADCLADLKVCQE